MCARRVLLRPSDVDPSCSGVEAKVGGAERDPRESQNRANRLLKVPRADQPRSAPLIGETGVDATNGSLVAKTLRRVELGGTRCHSGQTARGRAVHVAGTRKDSRWEREHPLRVGRCAPACRRPRLSADRVQITRPTPLRNRSAPIAGWLRRSPSSSSPAPRPGAVRRRRRSGPTRPGHRPHRRRVRLRRRHSPPTRGRLLSPAAPSWRPWF